jgi:hypothetical protein
MDERKAMVMNARIEEARHNLRSQLDKEKKHQWYIYHKKNYPYSRDTQQQAVLEKELDPENEAEHLTTTQKIANIPITSMIVAFVGIAAGFLLMKKHM